MASRNAEAHRTAHENWSQRDCEMVENFTYQDHARGLSISTRDGFKDYVAAWAESFSDGVITRLRVHRAGDERRTARFTSRYRKKLHGASLRDHEL
jgi:hypothetical protein